MRTDVTGDLFALLDATDPAEVGVAHGVNLRGVMGAGIAPLFARRHPGLLPAYAAACSSGELTLGGVFAFQDQAGRWVFNCASQDRPGRDARLEAVASSVKAALDHAASVGLTSVMIPRIGAGIGGLDWAEVTAALDVVADRHPVELVCVSLPGA